MNRKVSVLHAICVILKIVLKVAPIYILIVLIAGICHGAMRALETVSMQFLFDSITAYELNNVVSKEVLQRIFLLMVVLVGGYVFNGIHNALMELTSFKIMKAMTVCLHKKTSELDVEFYECSENLDIIEKAKNGIEQGAFFLNVCFSVIAYYIPYFIFMGIYLAVLKSFWAWALLLVFIPVIVSQVYKNKMCEREQDEGVIFERKYRHYEECINGRRFFKETRMWGAFYFFNNLYLKNVQKYDEVKWKTVKSTGKIELTAKSITLVGYMAIVVLFAQGVVSGEISVGAFAALFASVNAMFHTMEELICGHIASISENLVCIKNYVSFLEMFRQSGEKEIKYQNRGVIIEAQNLSYCYPGTDNNVLKNLNFRIEQGETIAIVGDNGAGKSTLMKLLSGQYAPTSGKLLINSIDSSEVKKESFVQGISAVFQNYQKYAMRLWENVHIGASYNEKSELRIGELLTNAGVNLNKWPEGMDVMLVREFGGTDISGGEWQKVAIARGAYKQCELILLDEPTAAIDPLEEERLYRIFEKMGKNKTSIIVTHRLGAAKLADRIFVMADGEFVECGSHEQLINAQGKYYDMHRMQKSMYHSA